MLAADHRARGVMTIERYADYLQALRRRPAPLRRHPGHRPAPGRPGRQPAPSGPTSGPISRINRTGLAGSVFELDDRLVASVARAAADGWTGVKLMTRIDHGDPSGAAALELLGQVLEEARRAHLEALIEPVLWRDGRMSRETADIVLAAVIAHDLGAPAAQGTGARRARRGAPGRGGGAGWWPASGCPVLFLGGPAPPGGGDRVLDEARDVMAGGGAGLAMGRAIFQEPSPAAMAKRAGRDRARPVILTIDLGTSVTKVALWDHGRPGGRCRSRRWPPPIRRPGGPSRTRHRGGLRWSRPAPRCGPPPGRLRRGGGGRVHRGPPDHGGLVDAAGAPRARPSSGRTAGPGPRPRRLADRLVEPPERPPPPAVGTALDAGVGGRQAGLADRPRARAPGASAWILTPRDLMVWRLTGEVATDPTMASRSGLYDLDGRVVEELAGAGRTGWPRWSPRTRSPAGCRRRRPPTSGLAAGTPVVIGAGDRACEVIGTGADRVRAPWSAGERPPTSRCRWRHGRPVRPGGHGAVPGRPPVDGCSKGGCRRQGRSWPGSAGSPDVPPDELAELARLSPPGAAGVVATTWLEGARAPWWRADAGAAFVGLGSEHGAADLARAGVRVGGLGGAALPGGDGDPAAGRAAGRPAWSLGGAGASIPVWLDVLTGITGLPASRRRSGQAASAGAALLAAAGRGPRVRPRRI